MMWSSSPDTGRKRRATTQGSSARLTFTAQWASSRTTDYESARDNCLPLDLHKNETGAEAGEVNHPRGGSDMIHLCINYDLNKAGKDYSGLIAALRHLGAKPACRSTWLLETNLTEVAVYWSVAPHLDADDFYMSVQIGKRPYWTRLLESGASWLRARWRW